MVYHWETYRRTIRRLYITEDRTLSEVRRRLKAIYNFEPGRRALQHQVNTVWKFRKPITSEKATEARLASRIKELWNQNILRPEMQRVLNEEGFQLSIGHIHRICKANGLIKRRTGSNSSHSGGSQSPPTDSEPDLSGDDSVSPPQTSSAPSSDVSDANSASPDNTKRQNSFKGDASGAKPRFPSDMLVSDARQVLGLSKEEFKKIRDTFPRICREKGIRSKAVDPEKWEEAKIALRHEHSELYDKLWKPEAELEMKQRALDTICKYVAKSKRLVDSKMTQREAKNALGLNPKQGKEARRALGNLLAEAGFDNKDAAMPSNEEWEDLKTQWGGHCAKIRQALDEITAHRDDMSGDESDLQRKRKAVHVLSRDVLKRLRDPRAGRQSKRQQLEQNNSHSDQPGADDTESQPQVDNLETEPSDDIMGLRFDIEELEIESITQSPLDGRSLGDFFPMDTLANVPESPYTPQTISSPISSTMTPYPPVGPSFGSQSFAVQPQLPMYPQLFTFTVGSNIPVEVIHYPPLPLANTHASFPGPPYAPQPDGYGSFPAQTMPGWPSSFGDFRRPF